MAFFAADGEGVRFCGLNLRGDFGEGALHAVPHDDDDVRDVGKAIEALPGVRDDGAAGDGQKKFVDVRAHARAFAGRDDDCANHCAFLGRAGERCKGNRIASLEILGRIVRRR